MKTAVVIPNWNGADLLVPCLKSLQAQTISTEIVVVDNGSTDESIEIIENQFPDITLIKLSQNLGFAGGVNTGIRYALEHGAEAVALFNNDAEADERWLELLVEKMQKTGAGMVACKLLMHDRKHIDSTGDFYSIYGIGFPRGRHQVDEGQFDDQEEVFGVSGGASLYGSKMLQEIGLFDERFFAYFEDVEISFRARLYGWKAFYEPRALAYHHMSVTSSKLGDFTRYHSVKNFLMIYIKNMPGRLFWKYLPFYIYQFLRTTARSVLDLQIGVWLRAVFTFIKYLPDLLADRRRIQKARKLSVAEVDKLLYKKRPPVIPNLES